MPVIHFTKNTGQFHPSVAYVATVPDELKSLYRGAGLVEIELSGAKPVSFRYIELPEEFYYEDNEIGTPADADHLFPGKLHAVASSYELVVDHGTALAALLNLAGDHS